MTHQLRLPSSSTKYEYIVFEGGYDLLTPPLKLKPGYVRDALNYELAVNGGYARCGGYERFDGHAARPSIATYRTLTVSSINNVPLASVVTGSVSGATGKIIDKELFAGSSDSGVFAYTQSTGTFVSGENLLVAGVPQAIITGLGGVGVGSDYDARMLALAANVYRALISQVPGSGPIRGVARLNDVVYAWRNNVGGTAMAIYKATTAGWTLVPLLYELSFTAGGTSFTVGGTVVQGGVSAVVKQIALQSGAWGGTAAGRLIIAAPTGGNFAAGAVTGSGGAGATASGIQTAITIPPNGRVQTDKGNFGGVVKLYGSDNVGRGFEFDGDVYAPIVTGNTPDVPQNVLVHKDHVFFSFGTNAQNSGITTPFNWTALAGSLSWRMPATITSLLRQPGDQSTGAMTMMTAEGTSVLYGKSAADFALVPFEESAGAKKYTGQRIGGQAVVFSDLGAFSVSTTQAFGNFEPASMTMRIRPFTQVRSELATASHVLREKSQYRVFFSDQFALYMTIVNGRVMGSMPIQFKHDVVCMCAGEKLNNKETAYFGSSDGFVYQLEAGTSFDGQTIPAYFTTNYAFQGNSRLFKRWAGVSFEVQGEAFARFDFTYDMGYGTVDRPQGNVPVVSDMALTPAYWDTFVWDEFIWDGRALAPAEVEMRGTEVNVAMRVNCESDAYLPFTVNSAILHYLPRKAYKK